MIKNLPWLIDEIDTVRNNREKINELVDIVNKLEAHNSNLTIGLTILLDDLKNHPEAVKARWDQYVRENNDD